MNFRLLFQQAIKFGLTGVLNTIVGFGVIYLLMFLSVGPRLSNLVGYTVAVIVSFFVNKHWTFKSQGVVKTELVKFITVFCVSYSLNYLTLHTLLTHDLINEYAAQLVAGVVYTGCSFILSRVFVFTETKNES